MTFFIPDIVYIHMKDEIFQGMAMDMLTDLGLTEDEAERELEEFMDY